MDSKCTVMLVEDDPYILKLCTMFLRDENYTVLQSERGKDALSLFYEKQPDIILLDLGLPDMDGADLIPLFRQRSAVPIIVVSARGEESEKIRALDLGADDYISKPFHTGELMARIRVAQRRIGQTNLHADSDVFTCGDLRVDFSRQLVFVRDQEAHLTPIEFRLLHLLIQNRGKVLTHKFIQHQIWGEDNTTDAQNLRVFMANLRRKIEGKNAPNHYILTQVGIGYRFTEQDVLSSSAASV
jgi:two-component system KDP operon response regulator KdpE